MLYGAQSVNDDDDDPIDTAANIGRAILFGLLFWGAMFLVGMVLWD